MEEIVSQLLEGKNKISDNGSNHSTNWEKIKSDIQRIKPLLNFEIDPREKFHLDTTKIGFHKERVDAWFRGEKIAPITIDMALTQKCQYACTYCYAGLQFNPDSPTTWEVYSTFLDDCLEIGQKLEELLSELTYLRFNISAGEPEAYAKIMGTNKKNFHKVVDTMKECVKIKKENNFDVTIGAQMVLLPECADQIIPLALLGRDIGIDYTIIKHCSDDENGRLGVDYNWYKTPQALD